MKRILLTVIIGIFELGMAYSQEPSIININDEADFREIINATLLNGESFHNKKIILAKDIVLQGDSILPIGMVPTDDGKTVPFQGEFDGKGHTITIKTPFAVYVSTWYDDYGHERCDYYSGLFGFIGKYGVVKNLNVTVENIQAVTDKGGMGVFGIIASFNAGLIYNCNVAGHYSFSSTSHNFFDFGFITGCLLAEGLISNCSNQANLIANKISIVGGIVGESQSGIIFKSHNTGDIKIAECTSFGGDGRSVGGIVGINTGTGSDLSPYVVNCINYGKMETNSNVISAGGIAGTCRGDGMIFYCGNIGDILSDAEYVGGVVGRLITSVVLGSYQAGCLYYEDGKKDKNKVIGIRWWGDEPMDECYIIGACNKQMGPGLFVRKSNKYYPKAETRLAKFLQVDQKGYSKFFQPEMWIISPEEPFPYFEH